MGLALSIIAYVVLAAGMLVFWLYQRGRRFLYPGAVQSFIPSAIAFFAAVGVGLALAMGHWPIAAIFGIIFVFSLNRATQAAAA